MASTSTTPSTTITSSPSPSTSGAKVLLNRRHIPPPRSRVRIAAGSGKRVHGQSPLASSSTTSPHSEGADEDVDEEGGEGVGRGLVSAVEKLTMELGLASTGKGKGHRDEITSAVAGGSDALALSHALASPPTSSQSQSHPCYPSTHQDEEEEEEEEEEYEYDSSTDEDTPSSLSFGHPLTRMVNLRVPDLSTRGLPQSGFASGVQSPVPRYPGAWGSNQHQVSGQLSGNQERRGGQTQYQGGLDLAALGSALSSTHSLGIFRGSSPEDGVDEGCWSDEDSCSSNESEEDQGSESSLEFTWDSWRRDFDRILDELDPGVLRESGTGYIDIPPSSPSAKDALLLRHFVLPTHHANEHKEPEPVQKADTLAAGPESSSSTDEHIEHHTSESTQPLPPSVSLQPPSPAGTAQKLSPGENSPKAETTGANCDGADADAPYEPDAHPSSEANHELVLILQLNHHEPREDPWNPVPHVVKAIERERSRGREKRVNVVEGGEVYSVCAGKHNGLGDEHGDGVGHGDEGVDVYIFMEGLRAWNDPPLKTVHNYIDLFRQILEGMAFLHEKHISLGPGTFASPAQLGLMVDIGYCAMSVVASPYPSGRQSQGDGASSSTSASASASRSVERGLTSTRGSTSTPAERRRGSRSPGRHGIGHAMDLRPLTRINGSPPTRSVVSPPAGLTSNPPLPSGLGSNPPLPSGLASNLGKSVGMSKAASASTASFDRTLYPVKYYFTNLAKAVQLDAAPPPAEGESVSENGNESGKVKAKGGMKGDVVDCAGLFETLLGEVPKIAPKLRTLVKAMKSGGFGAEDARKLFEAMVSSLEAGVFESSAGGGVE